MLISETRHIYKNEGKAYAIYYKWATIDSSNKVKVRMPTDLIVTVYQLSPPITEPISHFYFEFIYPKKINDSLMIVFAKKDIATRNVKKDSVTNDY